MFYSIPQKNGLPKTAKFGPKLPFWPNIGIVGPFDPMPDQKKIRLSCLGGFSVMWVPKLLLPPVKIRIFGQKRLNFAQNMLCWAHIGLAGSFGALLVWLVVVARGL